MTGSKLNKLITFCIILIWVVNGLFCKILNLVPRHQEIVSRILGNNNARLLTFLIGILEVGMAVWIASGIRIRFNVYVQIVIITAMNILEFILVPDLLLWGKFNLLFAFLFILLIYLNEIYLNKKIVQQK